MVSSWPLARRRPHEAPSRRSRARRDRERRSESHGNDYLRSRPFAERRKARRRDGKGTTVEIVSSLATHRTARRRYGSQSSPEFGRDGVRRQTGIVMHPRRSSKGVWRASIDSTTTSQRSPPGSSTAKDSPTAGSVANMRAIHVRRPAPEISTMQGTHTAVSEQTTPATHCFERRGDKKAAIAAFWSNDRRSASDDKGGGCSSTLDGDNEGERPRLVRSGHPFEPRG
jgi:hypothetical protein